MAAMADISTLLQIEKELHKAEKVEEGDATMYHIVS